MEVYKFGGSCLASPEDIALVRNIVVSAPDGERVVVVSAFQGVTDELIALYENALKSEENLGDAVERLMERHASMIHGGEQEWARTILDRYGDELIAELAEVRSRKEATDADRDRIMSFGERISAELISAYLSQKIPAHFVDARSCVATCDTHANARIDLEVTSEQLNALRDSWGDSVPIVTGFIGTSTAGATTTVGRNGSDYTAAALAACLDADSLCLFKDVDGVLSAHPELVGDAQTTDMMTYAEAMEMAHFGASVLHGETAQSLAEKGTTIYVRNFRRAEQSGTAIQPHGGRDGLVAAISSRPHVALLNVQGPGMRGVPGTAGRIFSALAHAGVNILLISQASSEYSVCCAIDEDDVENARRALAEELRVELARGDVSEVVVEAGYATIGIIGEGMRGVPGVSARVFSILGRNKINIAAIAQGASERNISCVVKMEDEHRAVRALHTPLIRSLDRLHLYVIGTGNIGGTLLDQLAQHRAGVMRERSFDIRVSGIINADKMLLSEEGVGLDQWRDELVVATKADLNVFIETAVSGSAPNRIVVDCTASEFVAARYPEILSAGIPVVTPNKKANTAHWDEYEQLRNIMASTKVPFLYETNVGAALPVIQTLKDLRSTGDAIERIEGVFSGTLSYICNALNAGASFSAAVREAYEKGYTEPDPRDDLSGMDVARKCLLLARESGLQKNIEDIHLEPVIAADQDISIDAFLKRLDSFDDKIAQLQERAQREQGALHYVGKIEGGRIGAKLQIVDSNHPFAGLSGSDNMIVFTTERYHEQPLVVSGPGAGAAVTAAGVFADILKAGAYYRSL